MLCSSYLGNGKTYCICDSGSGSALSLILNVEQYEYMRGPQNDAGIKVNKATIIFNI